MAENDTYQNENTNTAGWHSPAQGGITTPIAPEEESIESRQIGGWRPSFPANNTSCSSCTTPVIPGLPVMPGINYGQVRFINASTNNFPVTFSIDGTTYASNTRFSSVSSYQRISDGFHTVSVRRSTGIQTLLLQQSFPFSANQKVTMVLTDASEGGLQIIQVSDTGCTNVPSGYGCYRVANVSYSGSSFDVNLYNGNTIFRNVSFNEVTSYKRGMAGSYTFYLTSTNFYSVMRELPVIILGAITGTGSVSSPLASGNVTIQAGQNTTTYIMGNTWSSYGLRMVTVND